jgi:hypothetical protein
VLYGGSLKAAGVDLRALPVITDTQWMEHFDEVVVDPRLRLKELEAYVSTIEGDGRWLGRYRVMASSGTTGRQAQARAGLRPACERNPLADAKAFEPMTSASGDQFPSTNRPGITWSECEHGWS